MKVIIVVCLLSFSAFCNNSFADNLDDWKRLTNDATLFSKQEMYEEALKLSAQALAIAEQKFKDSPNRILTSLLQSGAIHQANGQFLDAEILFVRALNLQVKMSPNNQQGIVRTLMPLAKLSILKGNTEIAERILKNVIQRWETVGGRSNDALMEPLVHLARIYLSKGETREAENALARALAINKMLGVQLGKELASAVDDLLEIYRRENKPENIVKLENQRDEISHSLSANFWHVVKPEIDFSLCVPKFPSTALKYDLQGVVRLKVLVDIDGSPLTTTLVKSSGWQVLDEALAYAISSCNARPALQNGYPAREWVTIEYHWKIDENDKLILPSFEVVQHSCASSDEFSVSPDTTLQSTIRLAYKLDKDGALSKTEIIDGSSSGEPDKDQAAVSYLKTCKFRRVSSENSYGHIRLRWHNTSHKIDAVRVQ